MSRVRSLGVATTGWFRLHLYIFRVLANLVERIERLEAGQFHGQPVETVYVPPGMSVEVAWQQHKDGKQLSGTRIFILTDNNGNMLKVVR